MVGSFLPPAWGARLRKLSQVGNTGTSGWGQCCVLSAECLRSNLRGLSTSVDRFALGTLGAQSRELLLDRGRVLELLFERALERDQPGAAQHREALRALEFV